MWKVIEGFSNYEVSDVGEVRRVRGRGAVGKMLKPALTNGYLRLILRRDGKSYDKYVHRLVAEAFLPNPLGLPEVNHIHQPKTDCRVKNLEWRSYSGNCQHAYDTGLRKDCKIDRGVTQLPNGRWRARHYPTPNIQEHVGVYDTREEAVAARKTVLVAKL